MNNVFFNYNKYSNDAGIINRLHQPVRPPHSHGSLRGEIFRSLHRMSFCISSIQYFLHIRVYIHSESDGQPIIIRQPQYTIVIEFKLSPHLEQNNIAYCYAPVEHYISLYTYSNVWKFGSNHRRSYFYMSQYYRILSHLNCLIDLTYVISRNGSTIARLSILSPIIIELYGLFKGRGGVVSPKRIKFTRNPWQGSSPIINGKKNH